MPSRIGEVDPGHGFLHRNAMSAEPRELRRGFVLVGEETTVRDVRDRLATLGDLWSYVGLDASAIVLTGNGRLTLEDLNLSAPAGKALAGAPLVFVNACESAEPSPPFYDCFVPHFMARGARGVIGTECETPALFAAEWARRFFDRFLSGEPLGEAFLNLRREFYQRHHSLLGLLYALYCDGDTQVAPAVARTGGSDA